MARQFPNVIPHLTWCLKHDKKAFTKRNAKKLRRILPNSGGMCVYPCEAVEGGWHTGHLPAGVMRGEVTRWEVYPRQAA